jgi:hypothetical protein
LTEMLDEVYSSDDVLLNPRLDVWRSTQPLSYLRKVVREVEAVPGVLELPEAGVQKRVVAILVGREGGAGLFKVLSRRIAHFGFLDSEFLAQSFVENMNCISGFVKPFVLSAILKTVCNAWPTSRRYGHVGKTHCRLGCFSVAGDDLRHYPFCPVVESFIREKGNVDMCLWLRTRSLGHFMNLHSVNLESMIVSALWADIIFQSVNSLRGCIGGGDGFSALQARHRTVLTRVPLARRSLLGGDICGSV